MRNRAGHQLDISSLLVSMVSVCALCNHQYFIFYNEISLESFRSESNNTFHNYVLLLELKTKIGPSFSKTLKCPFYLSQKCKQLHKNDSEKNVFMAVLRECQEGSNV